MNTNSTEEELIAEAVREHLEDLEDGYIALQRLKDPLPPISSGDVKRELGLEPRSTSS